MGSSNRFNKDPDSTLDYAIPWSTWLGSDTIKTSTWIVPAGITSVLQTNTTTTAVIWLSGGTLGTVYEIVNRIVTVGGRTQDDSIYITIVTAPFTYDLATSIGQVRLAIGDTSTATGAGVRPDGTNLLDAEIAYFLTAEGDDVTLATARACEALSVMWANLADLTVGPRHESLSQVSARYAERATVLRGGMVQAGYISMAFAQMGP